jgi:hypothetical protein
MGIVQLASNKRHFDEGVSLIRNKTLCAVPLWLIHKQA